MNNSNAQETLYQMVMQKQSLHHPAVLTFVQGPGKGKVEKAIYYPHNQELRLVFIFPDSSRLEVMRRPPEGSLREWTNIFKVL